MEEILGRGSNAFWWSPDGTRLAFMRFDDAPVPVFPIYHADGQHGTLERTRYPKAGDPNPYVRIGVVSHRRRQDDVDGLRGARPITTWPSPSGRSTATRWYSCSG